MAETTGTMDQAVKVMADREGKYLTFSLADEEYGIGILKIREIIGMMPITSALRNMARITLPGRARALLPAARARAISIAVMPMP